ncbi:CotH protein [Pseudobythopirellula maris]|uniref:CotH protein n=1 Tax=Pseudobythopirellula maris TaxID=2527991 RepID=A0A5C5ZQH3_9BACT|nr:lamin tail domain-containing protein [Pseudobythopirellula maris]TWT89792.1 CotH protein [Pseudobythopirellula maris]
MRRHRPRKDRRARTSAKRRTLACENLEPRLALTVVIGEFLASNDSGLEDFEGDNSDWVELHNNGAATVDLGGWHLSDDATEPTKWQLPAGTLLGADERLVVFASGKDLTGPELHTNFSLSADGEDLLLVAANGVTVVDSFLDYPAQLSDIAYGVGADRDATVAESLIGDEADATVRAYHSSSPDAAVDDFWRDIGFDDSSWIQTKTGVGYDRDDNALDSLIYQELSSGQMDYNSGHVSAYVRVPFNVDNPAQLASMQLELRYDDGYIAYLNGDEIARKNVDTTYRNGYNFLLNARSNRPDSEVISTPDVLDLSAWIEKLEEGENVLSFYAANHTSGSQRNDFLIDPLLTAERATGAVDNSFLTVPTPGSENGAGWDGLVVDTTFSVDRGFYDAPFTVEIATPDAPGATIRYTTDGTAPSASHGAIYSGPVSITTTTTLRAAAFQDGYYPTDIDTQTYIFLDDVLQQDGSGLPDYTDWGSPPDWDVDPTIVAAVGAENLKEDFQAIPTVSLVMNWEELFGDGDEDGIYTETEGWKYESDERASSVEFFTADGAEEFHIDAAVEIQGNSTVRRWNTDKLSFQVKFKHPYGEGELKDSTVLTNSAVDGENAVDDFDTFILDAQYNYTWLHANPQQNAVAKYINDQVVSDYVNLGGGLSPHGRWVHLYLNGQYWGIYNLHERPDDSFIQEYEGGDEDDYYAIKAFNGTSEHPEEFIYVDGGLTAEQEYLRLLDEANDDVSNSSEYDDVKALLDIDDFINYMVVHYYAGNWDWGQDNWYATYNHVDPEGQWRFHAWDQEHAFPTDDNQVYGENNFDVGYDLTAKYIGEDEDRDDYAPTQIHFDLMESEEYRLRFADHVERLMTQDGLLTPAGAAAVFQLRIDELSGAINAEAARWGDNRGDYDADDWLANVGGVLTDFFPVRTNIVLGQFDDRGWLVDTAAPVMNQYGGEVASGFDLTLSNPNGGGVVYYTLDGSDPRLEGGGVAPSALVYSGAIDLIESTQVRTRVLEGGDWSAEVDKSFLVDDPLTLRIVELNYNPAEFQEHEFIELLNFGAEPISLDGVEIAGFANDPFALPLGVTLGAGERYVVARNPTEFDAQYGAGINRAPTGYADANLSNGGEVVTLVGPFGQLLQSFTYSDDSPWPEAADGDGHSLEYIGPFDMDPADVTATAGDPYDNAANWRASLLLGGSPGTDGSLVGDYDGSGVVDRTDYDTWVSEFGDVVTPGTASDGNGNGVVDAADFTVWRDNYTPAPPALLVAETAADEAIAEEAADAEPPAVETDTTIAASQPAFAFLMTPTGETRETELAASETAPAAVAFDLAIEDLDRQRGRRGNDESGSDWGDRPTRDDHADHRPQHDEALGESVGRRLRHGWS